MCNPFYLSQKYKIGLWNLSILKNKKHSSYFKKKRKNSREKICFYHVKEKEN